MVKCKQDILNMTSKFDVVSTLKTHPELWGEEVNQHLIMLAKKYLVDNFGSEDAHYDPLSKQQEYSSLESSNNISQTISGDG